MLGCSVCLRRRSDSAHVTVELLVAGQHVDTRLWVLLELLADIALVHGDVATFLAGGFRAAWLV